MTLPSERCRDHDQRDGSDRSQHQKVSPIEFVDRLLGHWQNSFASLGDVFQGIITRKCCDSINSCCGIYIPVSRWEFPHMAIRFCRRLSQAPPKNGGGQHCRVALTIRLIDIIRSGLNLFV